MKDTLGSVVSAAARSVPTTVAVSDSSGTELTWEEFGRMASSLAGWLREQGLNRGDRVLFLMDEQVEQVVMHAAVAKAAVVAVPVSYRLRAVEVQRICESVEPRAIVYSANLADKAAAAFGLLRGPAVRLQIGGTAGGDATAWDEAVAGGVDPIDDDAAPDDLVILGFTSGTTGTPKPIPLSQRAVREGARRAALAYGLPAFGTAVMSASMTFLAATTCHLWSHLWTRSTIILLGRYDLGRQWELVERHQATFTYVPTPAIRGAIDLLKSRPQAARSLKALNIGGSILPPDAVKSLVAVAGDCVVATYGLSEGTGSPICRAGVREWSRAADGWASAGLAVPPVVVDIVDPFGNPLPHDGETVGELRAQTDVRMRGASEEPEADWLRTGDLASIDPNGFVSIRGRSKEVIISGGINVYPAEVEAVIGELDGVAECAVVGWPSDKWGETPVAFVVPEEGTDVAALRARLAEQVRTSLAGYKCPTEYYFLATLPRNHNGKVLKRDLSQPMSSTETRTLH